METAKCAKCANCGEDTGMIATVSWALYCGKEACQRAFMDSVIERKK